MRYQFKSNSSKSMTASTLGEESPSAKIDILGSILKVLNHWASVTIFCVACFVFNVAGAIRAGVFIDACWSIAWTFIVLIGASFITIATCAIIQRVFNPLNRWGRPKTFDTVFDTTIGGWAIASPAFLTLAAFAFIAYPVEKHILVVDGVAVQHWTWVNPWTQNIRYVKQEQQVWSYAWATTRDSIRIRGTVEAELVLGADPSLWISDEDLQARAKAELQRRFETAVTKMDSKDLQHGVVIEMSIAKDTYLEGIGLMWKPKSIVTVANVHAAPPGS